MKLLIILFCIIGIYNLNSKEIDIEVIGKTTRQNNIELPNGKRYVSFKHEGGFKSSLARYGSYFCEGSIFYNKVNFNQFIYKFNVYRIITLF